MFIKKITISGFRSYAEKNAISELSSGHNVIIGGNGSGKSNVLNAIQFVLSDEFNGLNANQRQQLINENPLQRILMAFVEIVVDNTDRRMPLDFNEIIFRRQIGLKKDQYFINNKIVNHSDIANLLETAGFSRSNPYYIVKQGKVNEMSTASDEYRLQVMREVAGTRIYDQRKSEAMKLLAESRQRSQQIDDCLKSLDERLSHLQNENKDLEIFVKWDKRRRLLDYIIVNKESEKVKNQILKLEDKQREEMEVLDTKRVKLQEMQYKSRQCDKKLKVISGVLEEYRKQLSEMNANIVEYNRQKARIESNINDFNEKLDFNKENEMKVNEELKEVKHLIEENKKNLVFLTAKYEELKTKENKLIQKLSAKKSRKLELYSKQKRKESFTTVEDRNRWIRKELTILRKQINENEKQVSELKAEELKMFSKKSRLESEQMVFDSEEENKIKDLQIEKQEIHEKNTKKIKLQSKRFELLDSENALKEREIQLNAEKTKIESKLLKISGSSATVGRQSVQKVLQSMERKASTSRAEEARLRPLINGYLGQVIDCFTFNPNLSKAIEVVVKNKLFYHIIENDKIGTKILSEINENQMFGEITFIAVNKLKVKPISYPELENNARPLTGLTTFDNKYSKVMKFLFDRTLICRTLEVAIAISRGSGLDCVTLDGDFISHKGLMSGGYIGAETRMQTFLKWKDIDMNLKLIRQQINESQSERESNELKLNIISELLTKLDEKQFLTNRDLQNIRINKNRIRNELSDLNVNHKSIAKTIASMESTLPSMRANRDSFESELKLSLDSQLNESELNELTDILRSIESISSEHLEVCKERNKLGAKVDKITNELDKNLEQRKNELELTLIDYKIYENETQLESDSFELKLIDHKMDSLRKQTEELNVKIDESVKQKSEQKELLENLRLAEDKQMDIISSEAKKSRKISIRLENVMKKNDEMIKRLRNLGTIPSDCDNNYENISLSDQYKELQKCNQRMSSLTNVNQKASVQLSEGQAKQQTLNIEKREIDLGYKSIEALIETLEHQKYESIQLTYKSVSKHFCDIFKKLVPDGKAFIDMIYSNTAADSTASTASSNSQESQSSGGISGEGLRGQIPAYNRIDNFVGVRIRVAFTGRAVVRELNQLSGGQKSMVALAFIFAIQKCDPAPFYLFDEVDQALDPTYRSALTDIIKEMSKTSQFISTTFRPELLESADKFFGVKFRNRISHIEEISAQMAKDFIQSEDVREQTRKRRSVRFDTTDNESVNQ